MNEKWKNMLDYTGDFKDQLLQIAVYDLHASREQCVVIFEEDPTDIFIKTEPLLKFLKKSSLSLPLFINREFIRYSLDSYPLEFINIKSDYQNIYAKEDVLEGLAFTTADVRLQMERELKSKWLLTRQAILENPNNLKHIWRIVHLSLEALMPVLKGFFYLKNMPVPKQQDLIFKLANDMTVFDLTPLKTVNQASAKHLTPSMIYAYLDLLAQMTHLMETWQDDQKPL